MSSAIRLLEQFEKGDRRPIRILGASGQLGYGIPTPAFTAGLARKPDMIGCDMGSIDPGPYYLGSGNLATSPESTRRDLRKVLMAARQLDIPLVIGSAGSAGAGPHLDQTLRIVREIALAERLHFNLCSIRADIPRSTVNEAIRAGRVVPIDNMPALTEADVRSATHLVGQMGTEAIRRGLMSGADVVIAGRACDTAIYAALPDILGFPTGIAVHMAKIVECASLCCIPGGRDAILATLDDEGFELESMAPHRSATPLSVAAHSLYEQSDPFTVTEPEGTLDVRDARYAALDERRARVSGASWRAAARTTVKIEGARHLGHRAILLCGTADPLFIAQHQQLLEEVRIVVRDLVSEDAAEDYQLHFRAYGVNGVHDWQSAPAPLPREMFIMAECIAPSEARALEVVKTTKQYLLHHGYAGRLSTGGNVAFPFTPPELAVGPAYGFNVYHIMDADNLAGLFPVELETV
ncbi:MAG: acyclic terpene utilization AtuA family protein [Lautropia sp.]